MAPAIPPCLCHCRHGRGDGGAVAGEVDGPRKSETRQRGMAGHATQHRVDDEKWTKPASIDPQSDRPYCESGRSNGLRVIGWRGSRVCPNLGSGLEIRDSQMVRYLDRWGYCWFKIWNQFLWAYIIACNFEGFGICHQIANCNWHVTVSLHEQMHI